MSDKKPAIDRDAIRAMVRQVLRDTLPEVVRERVTSEVSAKVAPAASSEGAKAEVVSISSDGELQSFVRRVLLLAADPKQRAALQNGQLKFRLKQAHRAPESEAPARGGGERIDKGIVTERKIVAAAKTGKKLIVGKGVVVTPLARDKARQLGVQIEKE